MRGRSACRAPCRNQGHSLELRLIGALLYNLLAYNVDAPTPCSGFMGASARTPPQPMLRPDQQELLTRIGPGTRMGALLRRYWHPVAASSELAAGSTRAVRLLGEDLVLYRSATGRPALLEAACPHRRVSLVHGEVAGEHLICPYHGWIFNADGDCVRRRLDRRDRATT